MNKFSEKINIDDYSIENIDISEINKLSNWLPKNGVIDLNIIEKGLVYTLHGQNLCQDNILKIDRIISEKESLKNKAWGEAALSKASLKGYKTAKDKEWFALTDEDFIKISNEVAIAKASKKWFENKSSYFSGWHYAFKAFLNRDYNIEKLGNFQAGRFQTDYNESINNVKNSEPKENDLGGDIEW